MNNLKHDVKSGTIFTSNRSGSYEFLEEIEPTITNGKKIRMGRVKFIETGTIKEARILDIVSGKVKDPYRRNVAGVGYLGNTQDTQYSKKEYDMWRNMILRCYDENNQLYSNYGGAGVTVCEQWHSFENFLNDLPLVIGYNKFKYSLSNNNIPMKLDINELQANIPINKRIYSPKTCMFVEQESNFKLGGYSKPYDKISTYKGVCKLENGNYQCRVMIDGVDYFLGTYDDEVAAANMYNYVITAANKNIPLNEVEFMSINECLNHKTRNLAIKLPSQVIMPDIDKYNDTVNYKGVSKRDSYYSVTYYIDGIKYRGGKYKDQIAAANAYNYYVSQYNTDNHKLNDVPYMKPSEWLQQRYYSKKDIKPVPMYELTNESEEERKARCKAKYGVEFL